MPKHHYSPVPEFATVGAVNKIADEDLKLLVQGTGGDPRALTDHVRAMIEIGHPRSPNYYLKMLANAANNLALMNNPSAELEKRIGEMNELLDKYTANNQP